MGEVSLIIGINATKNYGEGILNTTYANRLRPEYYGEAQDAGLQLTTFTSRNTNLIFLRNSRKRSFSELKASNSITIRSVGSLDSVSKRLAGSGRCLQEETVRIVWEHRRFVRSKPGYIAGVDHRLPISPLLVVISFGAKTQNVTAQSTLEAELMAISYRANEAVYPSTRSGSRVWVTDARSSPK